MELLNSKPYYGKQVKNGDVLAVSKGRNGLVVKNVGAQVRLLGFKLSFYLIVLFFPSSLWEEYFFFSFPTNMP